MQAEATWWALAAVVAVAPLAGLLGVRMGRRTARKHPGMAAALWVLLSFTKVDPPPPPKVEWVRKSEEGAGDPPKV